MVVSAESEVLDFPDVSSPEKIVRGSVKCDTVAGVLFFIALLVEATEVTDSTASLAIFADVKCSLVFTLLLFGVLEAGVSLIDGLLVPTDFGLEFAITVCGIVLFLKSGVEVEVVPPWVVVMLISKVVPIAAMVKCVADDTEGMSNSVLIAWDEVKMGEDIKKLAEDGTIESSALVD